MKTREIVCEHYVCEGQCATGKEASFYGICQKCANYKPRVGAKPARSDKRRQKKDKQMKRDIRIEDL